MILQYSITENNPNTPQTWRVLLDDEFEAKLKIIKQDDETKKAVLQKNTEFKIYNMDTEKICGAGNDLSDYCEA